MRLDVQDADVMWEVVNHGVHSTAAVSLEAEICGNRGNGRWDWRPSFFLSSFPEEDEVPHNGYESDLLLRLFT